MSRSVFKKERTNAKEQKAIGEKKPETAYVPEGLASEESVQDLAVFHMDFSSKEDPATQCDERFSR